MAAANDRMLSIVDSLVTVHRFLCIRYIFDNTRLIFEGKTDRYAKLDTPFTRFISDTCFSLSFAP